MIMFKRSLVVGLNAKSNAGFTRSGNVVGTSCVMSFATVERIMRINQVTVMHLEMERVMLSRVGSMGVVMRIRMIECLVDSVLVEVHWLNVVLVIVGVIKAALSWMIC